ncbi:hypothetical protein [Reinekea sp. G2M2-21]|uniref:hypothetical protein n=1 Tax=Reinekea sp. G2M2-21 TaxID=2788942 RepID=UPI0018A9259F|nr:hypothetical protein [Reinekea sp. G2M2-21]
MSKFKNIFFIGLILILGSYSVADTVSLFENSVVSNEIDFITEDSTTIGHSLHFLGRVRAEMPDKRSDDLFDADSFHFKISFKDETSINVFSHSSFGSRKKAEKYVIKLLGPLGKLPVYMRDRLSHVVIHKGNETAFSDHLGHFFVVYSENMDIRIGNHDLEETVFHESVHATLDYLFSDNEQWLNAQRLDCCFVTDYAKSHPMGEDLAETSLFAYAYFRYPDQLPKNVKIWLETKIPNRLSFFRDQIFESYLR